MFVKDSERIFQLYLLGRQSFIIIRYLSIRKHEDSFFDKLSENPPIFVLLSFLITIFGGTLLLLLPRATAAGATTTFLDALFTSTSATCVTGLIVVDTGTHFTILGQLVILLLIQIGGLGIMSVSSAFAIMLGQKVSLRSESLMQNVMGESNKLDMKYLVKNIVIVTFIFELLGAIFLYFTFKSDFLSTQKAIYYAVFHSISSFCNAGFSLFPDSFVNYLGNLNINLVVTFLIIFGGIGFPFMVDIRRNLKKGFKFSRLSLHSKIVLSTTITLIVLGTIAFFIGEYNSEMENLPLEKRLLASFFQSVTTRTAGFNTIDNSELSRASVFSTIILMFIGASPGSTGGGIKTTTFWVVIIAVIAMLKGYKDVNVFKRKVTQDIIKKVIVLIAISAATIAFMVYLLFIFEPFSFEQILFEATSAFGTVGLSMGITSWLSSVGKIIIIVLMYLGRVGPLTLIYAISETKAKIEFHYTEEKIGIG
ncbi:MAG: TrkH family potassium uptake protein [Candidatus Cloacimonadota bacterium]|nr:TrkH family potassium uptake protein [Candidatus Cloacimonadota bacterium]